ncbi:MAG: hypothetical protein IJV98_03420 [Clostridia bacterium]|nr:hypothetical protein [Clostridia bacterium]
MKKYFALLLALVMILTIAACGEVGDDLPPMTVATTDTFWEHNCTTTAEPQTYPMTGNGCCTTIYSYEGIGTEDTTYALTGPGGTTYVEHDCTTTTEFVPFTSSRDDIEPLYPKVWLYDAAGNALPYYSELVWLQDGMMIADGALILMSVSSRLSAIAADIPLVTLGGDPTVTLSAREGVSISFKSTVNVYGEDYALLKENVPLDMLWEMGNAEWQGRTVYVYFTATFSDDTPDYEKIMCNGYFVKVCF